MAKALNFNAELLKVILTAYQFRYRQLQQSNQSDSKEFINCRIMIAEIEDQLARRNFNNGSTMQGTQVANQ